MAKKNASIVSKNKHNNKHSHASSGQVQIHKQIKMKYHDKIGTLFEMVKNVLPTLNSNDIIQQNIDGKLVNVQMDDTLINRFNVAKSKGGDLSWFNSIKSSIVTEIFGTNMPKMRVRSGLTSYNINASGNAANPVISLNWFSIINYSSFSVVFSEVQLTGPGVFRYYPSPLAAMTISNITAVGAIDYSGLNSSATFNVLRAYDTSQIFYLAVSPDKSHIEANAAKWDFVLTGDPDDLWTNSTVDSIVGYFKSQLFATGVISSIAGYYDFELFVSFRQQI